MLALARRSAARVPWSAPLRAVAKCRALSTLTTGVPIDPRTRLVGGTVAGTSHVIGATAEDGGAAPLDMKATVDGLLRAAVERNGEGKALTSVSQGARLSYGEFDAAVDACAAGLRELGVERGDRVGLWLPNVAEYMVLQFATARIGAIMVTVNPAYRVDEVKYALNLVGAKALVIVPSVQTSDYVAMVRDLLSDPSAVPSLKHVIAVSGDTGDLTDVQTVHALGDLPGTQAVAYTDVCSAFNFSGSAVGERRAELAATAAALDPGDTINIQFTSGTTGHPKAVSLSHKNIVNNGRFIAGRQHLSSDDVVCVPVPMYHCFGCVLGVLAIVSQAAELVYPSRTFDPRAALQAVSDFGCTALYGVPTMFNTELALPDFDSFDLSTLRTGIMAGSVCPVETMRRVHERMHMREVTIAYGMTETSPVSFQSTGGATPFEKLITTVGQVHPHVEARVIHPETKEEVPVGEEGALVVRGYVVMDGGYWGDAEATRAAIDDGGWMHTGDLASIDTDGYCTIVGRSKDTIIRGGENIAPRELEDLLLTHEAVHEVSVVGVRDELYGEQICACVILAAGAEASDETAESLRDLCRATLAHFKTPKYIRFVAEFPMTVSGKVQKYILRDDSNAALGL